MTPRFPRQWSKERSRPVVNNQDEHAGEQKAARVISVASTRKASTDSTHSTSRRAYRLRPITVPDEDLVSLALDTKHSIDWDELLLSARTGPGRWKLLHIAGDFALYTRQDSQRYSVLSVGYVKGCVGEILNVLQSRTSAQYAQQMEGIFEEQFKDGSYIYHVNLRDQLVPMSADPKDDADLVELTVKTMTFKKSGWLSSHEEWCYVDSVYRHSTSKSVEKLMTTIKPKAIVAGLSPTKTKYFHDVVAGYLVVPEGDSRQERSTNNQQEEEDKECKRSNQDDGHDDQTPLHKAPSSRVHFYGEFLLPKQFGLSIPSIGTLASDKTIKQRLLKLADSTSRLHALVRRQRLGMQTLIDNQKFLPLTNAPCKVCTKMLMIAKLCRLCGQSVCSDCSDKHERATLVRYNEKQDVALVRVCVRCLDLVDRATYDHLSASSLLGPHVAPDKEGEQESATVLKELLQDALLTAPSPQRKACVMSVIKCVLDQESESECSFSASSRSSSFISSSPKTPLLLTPNSSEKDYVRALDYLDIGQIPYDEAPHRTANGRGYQYDPSESDGIIHAPFAEDEDERQRVVGQLDLDDLSESVELDILCHLAATEMKCSASTISIFDQENLNVVASNLDAFQKAKFPRSNTICAHTILDKRANIVPHPEADIRYVNTPPVTLLGVKYYCAFPVIGEDERIIGSFCVMNNETMEISESQFSSFKKLADTANKVIKIQVHQQRRRKSSMLSTASSSSLASSSAQGPSDE